MTKRISATDWRQAEWEGMSEREFQEGHVLPLARQFGWAVYHTHDSRRSVAGFPDIIALRDGRMVVAELKSEKGRLSQPQKEWLDLFRAIPEAEVFVWRPSDCDQIAEVFI